MYSCNKSLKQVSQFLPHISEYSSVPSLKKCLGLEIKLANNWGKTLLFTILVMMILWFLACSVWLSVSMMWYCGHYSQHPTSLSPSTDARLSLHPSSSIIDRFVVWQKYFKIDRKLKSWRTIFLYKKYFSLNFKLRNTRNIFFKCPTLAPKLNWNLFRNVFLFP